MPRSGNADHQAQVVYDARQSKHVAGEGRAQQRQQDATQQAAMELRVRAAVSGISCR